ncbi:MAG: LysR family transcriptional regulator [Dokdonella sp.]|nr:LysR family transcriptional regulator [Dokdonella sp.]
MNLRDLRYLVALAEHRHFGRAAAASFVSQPTLSTQIRKLEQELGVALVERLPRKVLLTTVGREVVQHARAVLREVDEIRAVARRKSLRLDDLAEHSLLLLEDGHCLRDQALEVCRHAGAGEQSGFRATSLETLRQMVAANVGITLLPLLAVKPPVAPSAHVHLVPFRGTPPRRRIGLVWRKSSAQTHLLTTVAGLIRALPRSLFEYRDAA